MASSSTAFVFKTTALSVGAMVLVFFGVGLLLAPEWEVTTTRTLSAELAPVRELVGDFRTWSKWYAVSVNLGSPTKAEVQGQPGVVGQQLVWSGPLGIARLVLVQANEAGFEFEQRLEPAAAKGEVLARGYVRVSLQAEGKQTVVRWRDGAKWDNVMLRWFGWFGALQDGCKTIQTASLEALQRELEAKGDAPK